MIGSLLERYLLLVAGRLPADECGVLATVAGAGLAFLPVRALALLGPSSIPRLSEVAVDLHVLAFAAAAAIGTSLVFGLTPAISASGRLSKWET